MRTPSFLASLACLVLCSVPALAHADENALSEPPGLRWGIGLAGAAGAGYSFGDPAPGQGGVGGDLVFELGGPLSRTSSVYWAPQIYVFADQYLTSSQTVTGPALVLQNAAMFEWGGEHFTFGLGPALDLAWWRSPLGGASAAYPMLGGETRVQYTFGPREGQPRVFVGAALHASTVLLVGWATAALSVGVHTF